MELFDRNGGIQCCPCIDYCFYLFENAWIESQNDFDLVYSNGIEICSISYFISIVWDIYGGLQPIVELTNQHKLIRVQQYH